MRLPDALQRAWGKAWDKRTVRERLALAIMAFTIAGALWVQLLWSAHHARARYASLIAELQTRNDAMRQAAASMIAAKAQSSVIRRVGAERAVALFAEELRVAGIAGLAVLPDAQGRVRLVGTAEFDSWIAWLARTHSEYGTQVLHATIEPATQPGVVKIEVTMALPETR